MGELRRATERDSALRRGFVTSSYTQYKAKYRLLMIVTFSSICICIENINKTLCTKLIVSRAIEGKEDIHIDLRANLVQH